uniref:Uncharacterized protein n=1 Tax=Branchiostoma floridae TaxID=7739 RepID=C3YNX6_BRAFL|eukprot:XP_002602074.1 hypothetical protein BRAFLDRAFT_127349 [Branchiostoma floridae]
MATMVAFCEGQPKWFKDKENELLKTLQAAQAMKLNQLEEKGLRHVMEDVQQGRDPEGEDEVIRMELAYAFRNLMSLNPYDEARIKADFREVLGEKIANEIFEEGEKITEEELKKKQHVQKDLDFSKRQKGAWNHVVNDAKRGRDMTDHNKSILHRITLDASMIFALPPEELEAEKALLVLAYGEETAQRILDGIQVVHDEVKSKAQATSEAERAMKEVLAGKDIPHDQPQAAVATPVQVQAARVNPVAQAQGTGVKQDSGAKPTQAKTAGANSAAKPQDAGAKPTQVQAVRANPAAQTRPNAAQLPRAKAAKGQPTRAQAAEATPTEEKDVDTGAT